MVEELLVIAVARVAANGGVLATVVVVTTMGGGEISAQLVNSFAVAVMAASGVVWSDMVPISETSLLVSSALLSPHDALLLLLLMLWLLPLL